MHIFQRYRQGDRQINITNLVMLPQTSCNSLTNIVITFVTENTRFILEVNVMLQSDLSGKVNGETKKEADR